MELDELKKLKERKGLNEVSYSRSEIESIFNLRSKRSLNRLNRTMFWDAILMMIVTGILIAIPFYLDIKSRHTVGLTMAGMSTVLLIHYAIKRRLINRPIGNSHSILIGLQKAIRVMRVYFIAYYLLIPSLTVLLTHTTSANNSNILLIDLTGFFIGLAISHFLIRVLYGKRLSEFQDQVTGIKKLRE